VPTYECPVCQKNVVVARKEEAPFRPFCSERCKLVDLGRWLDGTYSVSEPISPENLKDTSSDEPTD
jgi:endogenous inhibitor of DNA gyrase (YacG/DUF329 family)